MGASVGRLNYPYSRSNRQGAEIEPGNASSGLRLLTKTGSSVAGSCARAVSTLVFFDLRQTRSPTFTDREVKGELSKR